MKVHKTVKTLALVLSLCITGFSVTSCSSGSQGPLGDTEISDPFEGANRAVFRANQALDDAYITPMALTYREVLPGPVKTGVENVLRHVRTPVNMANHLLQGDLSGAGNDLFRGIVNTFVGAGGLFDVAAAEGYEHDHEDFGQTMGVWGIDQGPYFVVPVLGPSTLRDSTGFIVDGLADPVRWYAMNTDRDGVFFGKTALQYITLRESLIEVLEDLENSSIDYYAATRSAYYQNRAAMVEDQEAGFAPEIPDYE